MTTKRALKGLFPYFLLFMKVTFPMSVSSSAAVMVPTKYEVFLSFRGVDTRNNFTNHLHARLCKSNIKTFIDYEIDRGNKISYELYTGIEESMIYVIIFSQNYASSSWCLKELVKILECKERYGRHVIPIFFKVTPTTVKHQKENYADAFASYINQQRFEKEEINKWKVALSEAGELKGTGVDDTRAETLILDDIVEDILKKLNRSYSSTYDQGIIGIEEPIAQIQSLLHLKSAGVRIIGIWGMGGSGKTTLARALHQKLATQFRSHSCVVNARQEIERAGINSLRTKILSELLEERIYSNGLQYAIERVKRERVLLILDDLKNWSQLEELIGGRQNFGQGSSIIVTSRDMQMLRNAEANGIYEVKKMNDKDSLQLFCLNAFKQNCPIEGYADLVKKVLEYAQGVPLALKVVGSLLHSKTRKAWNNELEKLPHVDIFNVLKLSYDELDSEQKDIFLDIACFYAGSAVDKVVEFLDNCGFNADSGLDVLKDRCLISILEGEIRVHDLIRDMGREIVRQECRNDPRKRSRLWNHNEIYNVLTKEKGKDSIHCIFLDICQTQKVVVHRNFFKSMHNMRALYFYKDYCSLNRQSNVIIPNVLESLPDSLKILHWDEFPQRILPLDFCPQNLVVLHLRHSHLEKLWENDQELPNLKTLDLSHSWNLIRIPDFSLSPNIKELILSSCGSLTSLPTDLCKLKLLRKLDLKCCSNLQNFPEIQETMEKLAVLVLDQTAIQELPSSLDHLVGLEDLSLEFCTKLEIIPPSIGTLTKLCKLDLIGCISLETFPSSIFNLKLTKLDLKGCTRLKTFPEILKLAKSFAHISLAGTAIKKLPSSLSNLVSLQTLCLKQCHHLESLPDSIDKLKLLSELDCSGCGKLTEIPNDICRLSSLRTLSLQDTGIVNLPKSIARLSSFESLDGCHCRKLNCMSS